MPRRLVATLIALTAVASLLVTAAVPASAHGTIDQGFTGFFTKDHGLNAADALAQSFTPTQPGLVAVDVFISGGGSLDPDQRPVSVNIRSGSSTGTVIGQGEALVPANTTADESSPYIAHIDLDDPVALTPGTTYWLQVDQDGGFFGWVININSSSYSAGESTLTGDFGFRTYYGDVPVDPTPDPGQCGNDTLDVPDVGAYFDFTDACASHDECYGAGGTESQRSACDEEFLTDMLSSCRAMWSRDFIAKWKCSQVARIYHFGVRVGGWAFFDYAWLDLLPRNRITPT